MRFSDGSSAITNTRSLRIEDGEDIRDWDSSERSGEPTFK